MGLNNTCQHIYIWLNGGGGRWYWHTQPSPLIVVYSKQGITWNPTHTNPLILSKTNYNAIQSHYPLHYSLMPCHLHMPTQPTVRIFNKQLVLSQSPLHVPHSLYVRKQYQDGRDCSWLMIMFTRNRNRRYLKSCSCAIQHNSHIKWQVETYLQIQ